MEKTGMIGYWSQYPGFVSKHITKTDKIIMRVRIIDNVVTTSGKRIYVCCTKSSSEFIVNEKRHRKK